ncbi:U6 snRNA-associated Sm-like protein LSm4 [Merluccius polli]|uniref:U6 snRNA-associated Sm-like protein LSm4 n=1 Tax=Merluccius polli TaxID=89951 RepID=A0AA47N8N9_MERPO|nr:U6 snRNA-associated Sm-like protein LSm4 [Merluccius polli]
MGLRLKRRGAGHRGPRVEDGLTRTVLLTTQGPKSSSAGRVVRHRGPGPVQLSLQLIEGLGAVAGIGVLNLQGAVAGIGVLNLQGAVAGIGVLNLQGAVAGIGVLNLQGAVAGIGVLNLQGAVAGIGVLNLQGAGALFSSGRPAKKKKKKKKKSTPRPVGEVVYRRLPLSLLKTAQNHPMLVELKNGETYNGHLVSCDNWMNINLREVICTSRDGDKFWRMPECYIRGSTIKYLRIPDEIIDMVKEEVVSKGRGRGGMQQNKGQPGKGRGGGAGRGTVMVVV